MLVGLFWLSAGLLAWVYLGYPTLVAIIARLRPVRLRPTDPLPSLTVAIAVHDEADSIAGRIADALADHLGLAGADRSWSEPLPDALPPRWMDQLRAEAAWTRRHLLPWLWRHAQGRSSGDGITPKQPQLTLIEG